jgi:hypothetical protein
MIRVHGSIAGLQGGYLVDLAYNNPRRAPSSRHHSIAPHLDTMNSNPNATVLRDRRASRQQQSSRYAEMTNTNENALPSQGVRTPRTPRRRRERVNDASASQANDTAQVNTGSGNTNRTPTRPGVKIRDEPIQGTPREAPRRGRKVCE